MHSIMPRRRAPRTIRTLFVILAVSVAGAVAVAVMFMPPIGPSVMQIQAELDRRLVERNGRFYLEHFYPNGQIASRTEFKRNEKGLWVQDGVHIQWDEDGTKRLEKHLRQGELHGPYRMWNRSGRLVFEGTYQNGRAVGDGTRYPTCDESGSAQ